MSLATYAGLTAAVPAWLDNRQDLAARIPEVVTLAEAKLNRRLRARLQVTRVTLSASAETAALTTAVLTAGRHRPPRTHETPLARGMHAPLERSAPLTHRFRRDRRHEGMTDARTARGGGHEDVV